MCTLTTYEEIRITIFEYHQSTHILIDTSSSSHQGPAPIDIGGLEARKASIKVISTISKERKEKEKER